MPILQQMRVDRRKPESCYLLNSARNLTSQCGEDGIIGQIFEIIGAVQPWCVELGAWDGKFYSNTYNLVANQGWFGVLIEGSPTKFPALIESYAGNPRAHCICGVVAPEKGKNSLDQHLAGTSIPQTFDLLSIDIDGNDYHVWESLSDYRPRVVIIEVNPTIPDDIIFIQDRDMAVNQGCSLRAAVELGRKMGYELICVAEWNAIFVVCEEFEKFGILDNSLDAMHLGFCDAKYFQGYDGTLFHIGLLQLRWAGEVT